MRVKISKVDVTKILDSRGCQTLSGTLFLADGRSIYASIPAGRSIGKYEAVELRDDLEQPWLPRGVTNACNIFKNEIVPLLIGREPSLDLVDRELINRDGTRDKSRLGSNTVLLASLLVFRAEAVVSGVEEFVLLAKISGKKPSMPRIRANLINGGAHADTSLSCQEIMIQSRHQLSYEQQLTLITGVYHALKAVMVEKGFRLTVGDEGGFAPIFMQSKKPFLAEHQALKLLTDATVKANCQADVDFCLDVAASEFYNAETGKYSVAGESLTSSEMIDQYQQLLRQYPIVSIEDGLADDDLDGWKRMTVSLGKAVELVGDDLFVTQLDRLRAGTKQGLANALLVKPNQVGTISETVAAVKFARGCSYAIIPSHRSGETNDTFIADLAVGIGADACKIGAPRGGERVAKYNRLASISAFLR